MKKVLIISLVALISMSFGFGHKVRPFDFDLEFCLPPRYEPSNNMTTYEGVALGKKLFYDQRLSADNSISCGTCHKQEFAFGDSAKYSKGIDGHLTKRNTLPLFNLAWNGPLFWDNRVNSLEELVLEPIQNKDEMAQSIPSLLAELKDDREYKKLFYDAFGDSSVTVYNIARGLGQFLRSITSYKSEYDSVYFSFLDRPSQNKGTARERIFYGFSQKAIDALDFCEKCHGDAPYGGNVMKNNGLDVETVDKGTAGVKPGPVLFKVPSIRNLKFTGPYMHDGRFKTIREVINHYNDGIQFNKDISPELLDENGKPIRLMLSEKDKDDVESFLLLLCDSVLIKDKAHVY